MANKTLLEMKYSRIVSIFAKLANISASKALRFFYHSDTYKLMSEQIADFHCYGDLYLADELMLEYKSKELNFKTN